MESTVALRVGALLALAAAALIVPGIPNSRGIAVFLLAGAALVVPVSRSVPPRHAETAGMLQDHIAAVVIAFFVPGIWAAAMLAIIGNSMWSMLTSDTRLHRYAAVLAPLVMIGVGALQRPSGWVPISLVAALLGVFFNILSVRLHDALRDREDDLSQALSTSGAIVHVSDLQTGRVRSVDGPIEELTGWTQEEWLALDHSKIVHPDDFESFWIDLDKTMDGTVVDRKARFRRADGTYLWIRDVSRVVRVPSGKLFLRGISMDVTEIEQAHELIRHQAETDSLTGLANRSVLTTDLESHLNAARPFALVLLDLDRFKNINDTLGHGFGDGVLVEIGKRLREFAGPDDTVVRLGGDEFALIVADMADEHEASTFAAAIAAECSRVMSLQGVTISSGASIGITLAPRDGITVKTLLRHADIAMYAAKRDQLQYQIFDQDIQQAPLEEVTLSGAIGHALENDEFVLHFQPRVDTVTGEVIGYEGLARWDHPTFGLISPNRFIHLVSLSTFANPFADRVLELGASFAARCAAAGKPVPVSVNMSARSLYDATFPDRVAAALIRNGLSSEQLIIEITEHDIMNQTDNESGVMGRLGELGVALSIDDFGTGYSSLARLIDLPVSEIKIDRRFVARLLTDEQDAVVVRSIVDLGNNLGLQVIAEGIELRSEAEALREYGCTQAQGFLYSKPVAPDVALAQLHGTPVEPAVGLSPTRPNLH